MKEKQEQSTTDVKTSTRHSLRAKVSNVEEQFEDESSINDTSQTEKMDQNEEDEIITSSTTYSDINVRSFVLLFFLLSSIFIKYYYSLIRI